MHSYRKSKVGLMLVLGVLVPAPHARAAAADYFDLSPEQLLEARIVSASRTNEPVAETPAAVYVITQEAIARSGMTTVPELLRLAPGVDVARVNSSGWAISIRGFNDRLANKILVMVDGRSVYDPLFAGTFWAIQDIPVQDIERIEVVRGPGGALWGANATNGVINIVTKNAYDTQGNLIVAGGGNYEQGFVTARHGGVLKDGDTYYRMYAKYNNRAAFEPLPGHNADDDWQNRHGGFRIDSGRPGDSDRTSLHGDVYHVTEHNMDTTYSFSAPFSITALERVDSDGANLVGDWRHTFNDGSFWKTQAFVDYVSRDQNLFQDKRATFDIDTQYNFVAAQSHEMVVGGNLRYIFQHTEGSPLVEFDPSVRRDVLASVFAQDKITLQPNHWFATLGAKLEHNAYTGYEFAPNARLEWLPDDMQAVWTSVSRAVRTPSRIERDISIANVIVGPGVLVPGFPAEVELAPNKNFSAETLVAYEAGYRKQVTRDISVDTAIFANNYRNLASSVLQTPFFVPAGTDPAHYVFPLLAVNQMNGEVYGGEVAATWQVNPDWKLTAGYARLDMFLHAPQLNGGSQEGAEGRSPRNQFNLRSYWNINDSWTLDLGGYYVGKLPNFKVPAYVRVDANLGWQIREGLRFNLVGQNLLQSSHHEFSSTTDTNTTEVPRSLFGKLTWTF